MKKIFLLVIVVLTLSFISCSQNSGSNNAFDPNGIATKNNATDDMFEKTGKTNRLIIVTDKDWGYGWYREEGTSGILGTWYFCGNSNAHLTFYADGTYHYIDDNLEYIDRISDNYELYVENDIYHIIIWNGTRGYKSEYLTSDNYLSFSSHYSFF